MTAQKERKKNSRPDHILLVRAKKARCAAHSHFGRRKGKEKGEEECVTRQKGEKRGKHAPFNLFSATSMVKKKRLVAHSFDRKKKGKGKRKKFTWRYRGEGEKKKAVRAAIPSRLGNLLHAERKKKKRGRTESENHCLGRKEGSRLLIPSGNAKNPFPFSLYHKKKKI